MGWTRFHILRFGFLLCLMALPLASGYAQDQEEEDHVFSPETDHLTLVYSVICEEIRDLQPRNVSRVFSIKRGEISCFSFFDPVPTTMFVIHTWYFRDRPSARYRLTLKPPRWATYSTIQLRETDKGPWRVEITDPLGNVIQVLRFSITD
jgi:hypothetical protein